MRRHVAADIDPETRLLEPDAEFVALTQELDNIAELEMAVATADISCSNAQVDERLNVWSEYLDDAGHPPSLMR